MRFPRFIFLTLTISGCAPKQVDIESVVPAPPAQEGRALLMAQVINTGPSEVIGDVTLHFRGGVKLQVVMEFGAGFTYDFWENTRGLGFHTGPLGVAFQPVPRFGVGLVPFFHMAVPVGQWPEYPRSPFPVGFKAQAYVTLGGWEVHPSLTWTYRGDRRGSMESALEQEFRLGWGIAIGRLL